MTAIQELIAALDAIVCPLDILAVAAMSLPDSSKAHETVMNAYTHVARNSLGNCGCPGCIDTRLMF